MEPENMPLENAALSELRNIRRSSFSSDGFTPAQENAIASAIASAIAVYDEMKKQ